MSRSLAERLDATTFQAAWARVRRSPGAGRDGITADRFGLALQANLDALRLSVLDGRYRPGPLLRREIPKPGGIRRLGIPTVADRLVQAAVLEAVALELDRRFLPSVQGYRPGRSVGAALTGLSRQVGTRPWLELVHADIDGLFDHLPHRGLLAAVDDAWADPLWRDLHRAWLRAWTPLNTPGQGIPQGAPLSPLLANLALDRALDRPIQAATPTPWKPMNPILDRAMLPTIFPWTRAAPVRVCAWMRYGDDLVLTTEQRGGALALLRWLDGLVRGAGMALSARKTVLAAGGAASRPLPRPVLGAEGALVHVHKGWALVFGPFPSLSAQPDDPWRHP